MNSVFDEYKTLWPESSRAGMEQLLSKILVMHYPRDKAVVGQVDPRPVVVVTERNLYDGNIPLIEAGFEHLVQSGREDFAAELLASSLMALRPDAFMKNPMTFFFNGFQSTKGATEAGRHVNFSFLSSAEKSPILSKLEDFLNQNPQTSTITDICLQTADEMVSNAIYHAPIKPSGTRPNAGASRDADIVIPGGKSANLFACFSDQRVIIGCQDQFGSLERTGLMLHLRSIFKDQATTMRTQGESAGLGFKYMIENAANFYVLVTKSKQTLIACGFLLKGLKANTSAAKHLHFSFR